MKILGGGHPFSDRVKTRLRDAAALMILSGVLLKAVTRWDRVIWLKVAVSRPLTRCCRVICHKVAVSRSLTRWDRVTIVNSRFSDDSSVPSRYYSSFQLFSQTATHKRHRSDHNRIKKPAIPRNAGLPFYFTIAPFGMPFGTVASVSWSPTEAARIMPCDSSPRSFAGFRFVTQMTLRPTSSSGL